MVDCRADWTGPPRASVIASDLSMNSFDFVLASTTADRTYVCASTRTRTSPLRLSESNQVIRQRATDFINNQQRLEGPISSRLMEKSFQSHWATPHCEAGPILLHLFSSRLLGLGKKRPAMLVPWNHSFFALSDELSRSRLRPAPAQIDDQVTHKEGQQDSEDRRHI